jgi:hypothetical protein
MEICHRLSRAFLLTLASIMSPSLAAQTLGAAGQPVIWELNRLDRLGDHATTVVGSPRVVETARGKAVEFGGSGDALFVDANPLAGLKVFTAEIVFQPYADGAKEQRFFHLQENGTENRLLFETRLTGDGRWFLDTFIKTGEGNHTLFAENFPHAIGPWYAAAVTVDGKRMRHYVNGVEELSTPIQFQPQMAGTASIGVRINKVFWYRGAVRQIRITPRVLAPHEFIKP